MQLTDKELDSELWRKLMAHLTGLLDKAHVELEKTSNTESATAQLRGRAKLIRELQKLGKQSGLTETAPEYR